MTRRALDVTGSILTTLLVFGATPAVLVSVVGDPLGGGMGHQWSQEMRFLLAAVALVAWVAWAVCCTQLARAVVEQVRQGYVGTPTGTVLTDRVAARIAAGVLALVAFGAPLSVSAGAGAGASGPQRTVTVGRDVPTASPALASAPASAPSAASVTPATGLYSYVVRPGDSLWSIAAALLGDGDDWPAIAALNLGRTMADGLQFVDPNTIHAGWTLLMPDQPVAPVPVVTPVAPDVDPGAVGPTPRPASTVPAQTDLARRWLPVASPTGPSRADDPARADDPLPAPFGDEALVLAHTGSLDGAGPGRLELPGLAALGVGALACAALTRRARRTRLLRQATSDVPDAGFPLSESAIDASILLARGAGLPALRAFEAANYGLAAALAGRSDGTVSVRAVCVGPAGVDFWMAEAGRPAPDGLTLSPDGRVWHAAHGVFSPERAGFPERTGRPLLPIVLPVGEDDRGTWLVPLGEGCTLSLLGESAPALWRAARPVQEAWSWADLVLVTEDALVASGEAQLRGDGDDPGADATQVLFFGDPAELTDAVARRIAIVTLTCAPSSDVTVLVDRRGASIHPLGRTVRPHLMDDATARAVRELVEPVAPLNTGAGVPSFGEAVPPLAPGRPATALTDEHALREKARAAAADLRRPPRAATFSPSHPVPDVGAVEVRLLTPTPRLEGLATALPPSRVRRAVELVAYLASHAGEEVTSDRLRTRVLGSSETDAASKTLFNIATEARRAMGLDAAGNPLFPFGTRTGHYRVAEGVTTDVQRAASLALAGNSTEDPDTAMGLLRSALDLVEGEPMINVLSGYTWWEVEGHRPRIAAVLVNAAGNLAALAIEAELFELAQWGLAQARLVDPYSEPISRAAMQVAAAAGDVDRLRREWGDYRRRLDELDPGNAPHPRAERLYGELSRLVLVGARRAEH